MGPGPAGKALLSRTDARDIGLAAAGTLALMGLVILSDREGYSVLRWAFVVVPAVAAVMLSMSANPVMKRLAAVCVLFLASMIFFAIFEQAGVTIALFADQFTRTEFAGFTFPSAWFQSLNPLFVIALARSLQRFGRVSASVNPPLRSSSRWVFSFWPCRSC